jgi:hypothetical protein
VLNLSRTPISHKRLCLVYCVESSACTFSWSKRELYQNMQLTVAALVCLGCWFSCVQHAASFMMKVSSGMQMSSSKGFGSGAKGGGASVQGAGRGQKAMEAQMQRFNIIKNAGGLITDVYARAPGDEKFYFSGKLATGVISIDQALQLQKALIADHIRMVVPDLPDRLQVSSSH